jgi:hypothetical protein
MAKGMPNVPALRSADRLCLVPLGTLKFDERPLNKGACAKELVVNGERVATCCGVFERIDKKTVRTFS